MAYANLCALYAGVLLPCMASCMAAIYPSSLFQRGSEVSWCRLVRDNSSDFVVVSQDVEPPHASIQLLEIASKLKDLCMLSRQAALHLS